MIDVYKERLEKQTGSLLKLVKKAIVKLNVITPHIGYPEKLPETYAKRSSTRARPWLKMLKPFTKFPLPILGASGTNRLIERMAHASPPGQCLLWSATKPNRLPQQRFYKHLSMTFTNHHQPTTVESVQSLPMKSPHAFDTNGASFWRER